MTAHAAAAADTPDQPRLPARYHGPHPTPPRVDAEQVEWRRVHPPFEPARVIEHTCECRAVLYELCSRGGARFIRKTTRGPGRWTIAESPPAPAARVRVLWGQLLSGAAR
jgi:hypothetical protein